MTFVIGAGAALLLLALFVAIERRSAAPMIDLALFRNAEFALGALAALVIFMGIASTRFLVPFFLQAVRGIPAGQVGLVFVPAATVTAIAAPFAGRFADRFGGGMPCCMHPVAAASITLAGRGERGRASDQSVAGRP